MEIKAECTYDYDTCKAIAHAYIYKKQKPVKALISTYIFCLLFALADIYVIGSDDSVLANYIILILLVFVFVFETVNYFLVPRIQYKSLSKMKDLGNDYVFRDEDFTAETASEEYSGDSVIRYSFLYKVMETEKYFFLFQNKRQIFAVDKSTLEGGTAEDIRKKLQPVLGKRYIICKY